MNIRLVESLSVCLWCSNFRKPWPRKFVFWYASTSSESTGHILISRSSGQGQGHKSKKLWLLTFQCLWTCSVLIFLVGLHTPKYRSSF